MRFEFWEFVLMEFFFDAKKINSYAAIGWPFKTTPNTYSHIEDIRHCIFFFVLQSIKREERDDYTLRLNSGNNNN